MVNSLRITLVLTATPESVFLNLEELHELLQLPDLRHICTAGFSLMLLQIFVAVSTRTEQRRQEAEAVHLHGDG